MSLPSLPSLPPTPAEDPDFVNIKETEKYYCILHNGVLRNAMQTLCGHRFCESCINTYLQSGDSRRCPANEDDCVDLGSSGESQHHVIVCRLLCSNSNGLAKVYIYMYVFLQSQ